MKIREIASGLQFPEGPWPCPTVRCCWWRSRAARSAASRPTAACTWWRSSGGGPNGAAIGPDGAVYVCNNGGFRWTDQPGGCLRPIGQPDDYSGGRIERVDLGTGRFERLYDRIDGIPCAAPTTWSSPPTAASGSPTWARCATPTSTAAASSTPAPTAARPGRGPPGDDAQRHRAVARRPHALLRRDRGRAAVGLRRQRPGRVDKLPWPSPQRRPAGGGRAGRPLPALRLDGGGCPGQRAGGHAAARRHHGGLARRQPGQPRAAARPLCRPTSASADPACARCS
jgi:hypothetical protein